MTTISVRKNYPVGDRMVSKYPIIGEADRIGVAVTVFLTPTSASGLDDFTVTVTAVSASQNKIREFFEFVDDYIDGATNP